MRPEQHIFEIERPDGSILEIEAPKDTPVERIKARAREYDLAEKAKALKPTLDAQAAKYPSSQELGRGGAGVGGAGILQRGVTGAAEGFGASTTPVHSPVQTALGLPGFVKDIAGIAFNPMATNREIARTGKLPDALGLNPVLDKMREGDYAGALGYVPGAIIGAMTTGRVGAETAAKVKTNLPTPEGLMQRAGANRQAAAQATRPSDFPTSKTGLLVTGARKAAAPIRNTVARAEEALAQRMGGRRFKLDSQGNVSVGDRSGMGNPEVGSAAFMPENLTRPPDAPVVPRSVDAGPPVAPPQPGPLNVPRPGLNPLVDAELQKLRGIETPEQLYQRQQALRNVEFQPAPQGTNPVGVQKPPVNPLVEAELNRLRQIETPDQLYARQQQLRSVEFQPDPTATAPVAIPRPQPAPVPQVAPKTPQMQVKNIEQGIAPSGTAAKASTLRNTPRLQKLAPELGEIPPGPQFDGALVEGFRKMEAGVDAAEAAVPRSTNVPKTPIVDQWKTIAQDYLSKGDVRSAALVQKLVDTWAAFPDQIPWEQFVATKRGFFGNGSRSPALRRAYQPLMDESSKISADLAAANGNYSIFRRALDDAKIDTVTGRRIMQVGKPTK